ncbi:uncharacterized protein METZ01_LOCUS484843 [marine metagenome]|uniref:Uncharacterized protein n=1 Tax=marine metagenome TaxID=408172 RepID=A0A383CIV1_9ZZZZ
MLVKFGSISVIQYSIGLTCIVKKWNSPYFDKRFDKRLDIICPGRTQGER